MKNNKKIIFTNDQTKDIISLCIKGISNEKISKKYNCSPGTIKKLLKQNNLQTRFRKRFKLTPENELQICDLYNKGMSSLKISKLLNASKPVVLKALRKHNTKIKSASDCQMKHIFDINYFENIDSHEKAYWLGFISGDGCVHNNHIIINLSTKDISVLENFKKCINSDHTIKTADNNINSYSKGKTKASTITISSQKMANDLRKYNLANTKTQTFSLSKLIQDQFLSSYILGLNDADGCFRLNKGSLSFSMVGTQQAMLDVQIILMDKCNLKKTKLIPHHSTSYIFYLEYHGIHQMTRIVNYLYKDMPPIFLMRKYNRVKHLLTMPNII